MAGHGEREVMLRIKCCEHCVPPKRKLNCHSYCPDYHKEKLKARLKQQHSIARREVDEYFIVQKAKNIRLRMEKEKRTRK
jgi:hypothetical protein